jgi:hypothetical protein
MFDLLTENNATVVRPKRVIPKMTYKFMASGAAVVVGLMILVPTANSMFKSTSKSHATTSQKVLTATKQSVTVPATQGSSTDSRKQQSAATTTSATGATSGNLVFSADSGTTWIAVTAADGTNIFTGKITQGQSQSFDASQLLNVTLGNAGAVSVWLNGKSLGIAGLTGQVKYLQYGPGASSPVTTG